MEYKFLFEANDNSAYQYLLFIQNISLFSIGSNPCSKSSYLTKRSLPCLEDANSFSINSMVHLETRLLGQKWTKKWRSRLFEDEIAEFLDEIQEYAKHIARMMDVIYLLGGISSR